MTDKKFKEIVNEHPYLVNPVFVMTRSAAEEIYSRGFPTAEEIIAGAKKKSNLPSEAWKEFDTALARKKKDSLMFERRIKYRNTINVIRAHRMVAIALAIFLFLTSFFTFVPASRAFAKEIYQYIINLFDNRLEVGHNFESDNSSGEFEIMPEEDAKVIQYQNFEEFYAESGLEPFVIDWLTAEKIVYEKSIYNVNRLTVSYYDGNDTYLKIRQEWGISYEIEKHYDALDDYRQLQIRDEMSIYYSIDPMDEEISGVFSLPNSIVTISTYDEELFEQLIEHIKYPD